MKIFTYLRTLWHEIGLVGTASVEPVAEPLAATFGTPVVNHNLGRCLTAANSYVPKMDFGSTHVQFGKKLWVYNVSRVDHKFDHPMLGNVTIPANMTKRRYSLWTSFPEVVMGMNYNIEENLLFPHAIKGEYFVNDMINPDSHGGQSIGRDLSVRGVFWSYNNPPKVSEVLAAVKKLKAHYADLLEKAEILYSTTIINSEKVEKYIVQFECSVGTAVQMVRVESMIREITPEHHAACEYFKVTTPWHPALRG